jgi:phage shock protein E
MKFHYSLMLVFAVGCSTDDPVTNNLSRLPEQADSNESASAKPQPAPSVMDQEFVIDVRSQSEWDSGHVAQAIHIPHEEITDRIAEVTSDKNAKIVVYCAVGGRAGLAKEALEQLGFTKVENAGGYDDVKASYE